ncbi:hypothetical protein HY837_04520, partial [archaeon]|nr:hypothetical protein [archaeon]
MKKEVLMFLVLASMVFLISCVAPAGYCGDGICDFGEQYTCPQDCQAPPKAYIPQPQIICGDNICDIPQENDPNSVLYCPSDCGMPLAMHLVTKKTAQPLGVSGGMLLLELNEGDIISIPSGSLEVSVISTTTQSAQLMYNGITFPKMKAGDLNVALNNTFILTNLYSLGGKYVIDVAVIPRDVYYEYSRNNKEGTKFFNALEDINVTKISNVVELNMKGTAMTPVSKGVGQTVYGVDTVPTNIDSQNKEVDLLL